MGCSSNKAQIRAQSIVKVLTYSSHATRNLPTSISDEVRCDFFCMKIRIYDTDSPDWEEVTSSLSQMSGGVFTICSKVYKHCNHFHSVFSYLEHQVHGVCLSDFSLVKALELIFLNAKLNNLPIFLKKKKSFPFIDCKSEEPETIKVWNEIGIIADELMNKKSLETEIIEIKEFLTRCLFMKDENLQNKGFAVVGEYLKLYVETCDLIQNLLKELDDYINKFKTHKKILYMKIDKFHLLSGMTYTTLVHSLI